MTSEMDCGRVELPLQVFFFVPVEDKVCLPAWLGNARSYLSFLFSSDQSHLWVGLTLATLCLPEVSLLHRGALTSVCSLAAGRA